MTENEIKVVAKKINVQLMALLTGLVEDSHLYTITATIKRSAHIADIQTKITYDVRETSHSTIDTIHLNRGGMADSSGLTGRQG